MHALLLHSPSAGEGGPSTDRLLDLFRRQGFDPSCVSVKDPGIVEILAQPHDLIVAVGGDGTVTRVLTHMPDRAVPVAILPQGTANNIARSLGITGSSESLIAGLRDAREQRFDIGAAIGPWGRHRFVEAVGLGLLARGMAEIDATDISGEEQLLCSRRKFGRLLMEAEPECLKMTVDGQELTGDFLVLEIMNISHVGPNLNLAPKADPGDGLLDVVYAPADRRAALLDWLNGDGACGGEGGDPPVEVIRAARVEITWAGTSLRLGDNFSPAPRAVGKLTVELEPQSARILIPRNSATAIPQRLKRARDEHR
jgi:diacylglycerol kinase (ATP)